MYIYGKVIYMKTTVVIGDRLFARAQKAAKARGVTMRELIEDALRNSLTVTPAPNPYVMPDCSVGDPRGSYPLAGRSWEEVRDLIYPSDKL